MNRKRISYREFIEQIKVKGNLYMPVIEGKNKMYPLIVTENHGEKIRTSDGRMHLSKMPELDMWVVYERCGQAFDEVTLKNMLAEYTEEYTRQAELDKKRTGTFDVRNVKGSKRTDMLCFDSGKDRERCFENICRKKDGVSLSGICSYFGRRTQTDKIICYYQ